MTQRMRGTVKWFSAEKGYGFITPEDGGDIFVHYSEIQHKGYRKLEAGEPVEFILNEAQKGRQANEVTRLNRLAYVSQSS